MKHIDDQKGYKNCCKSIHKVSEINLTNDATIIYNNFSDDK